LRHVEWRMICLHCSDWDEITFDAKLMKFQTRIKLCSRNRWYKCIPNRDMPMACSYQSVWSIDSRHALSIISGQQLRSDVKINCSRDAHLITAICIFFFYSYPFPRNDSSLISIYDRQTSRKKLLFLMLRQNVNCKTQVNEDSRYTHTIKWFYKNY